MDIPKGAFYEKIFALILTLVIVFSFVSTISFAASWNEVELGSLGDTNCDGKINVNDVSILLKYIAKWNLGEQTFIEDAADVTQDDIINTLDLTKLLRFIAGVGEYSEN